MKFIYVLPKYRWSLYMCCLNINEVYMCWLNIDEVYMCCQNTDEVYIYVA